MTIEEKVSEYFDKNYWVGATEQGVIALIKEACDKQRIRCAIKFTMQTPVDCELQEEDLKRIQKEILNAPYPEWEEDSSE